MLPRLLRSQARRAFATRNVITSRPVVMRGPVQRNVQIQKRTMIAAPKPGDGPLMSRRADRELPEIEQVGMAWAKTIPIFLLVLLSSTLGIFNYQKSTSPVVSSTLYALRTSPKAREALGDEVYFASKMPWIWGEMNQLHGRIDIQFEVKGTKGSGTMRFKSYRQGRQGMFETTEWSLEMEGKEKIDLLEGGDPFKGLEADEDEPRVVGRGSYAPNLSG